MKAVLVKEGLDVALEGKEHLPETMDVREKRELLKKAYSSIILGLEDKVLREVSKETTVADVWRVLEESFKMKEGRSLSDNLDDFTKLIQDMERIQISIEGEDQAMILLNYLPQGNEHFVDTLKYGRQILDVKEVIAAIIAKDAENSLIGKSSDGLGLTLRGRTSDQPSGRN
nr:uncharacterized protein LOC125423968 [Ziziphus jujuba var. spinosa]